MYPSNLSDLAVLCRGTVCFECMKTQDVSKAENANHVIDPNVKLGMVRF